jgi:hypothetical protein
LYRKERCLSDGVINMHRNSLPRTLPDLQRALRRRKIEKRVNFDRTQPSINQKFSILLDEDMLKTLKSRQSFISKSLDHLAPLKQPWKAETKQGRVDELMDKIDRVDLTPLRRRLELGGRRFHESIQQLNLSSGAVARNMKLMKLARWKNRGFTKVESELSKREVLKMCSQIKREAKAIL